MQPTIRSTLRPGDAGAIIALHGRLYCGEFGYHPCFEGYVAKTFADYLTAPASPRDRFWLVEREGELVGSLAILDRGDCAQLRWFLLLPELRGKGLGRRLVEEAVDYCRTAGFPMVYLETATGLDAAHHLYRSLGFQQLAQEHAADFWLPGLKELRFELPLASKATN
ncbi:MAG: GNAT family N-acetyltransferase [Clostridia bacterium]|nr:GNAT family N-acetyltransferase [Clostridia bacterium]